MGLPGVESFPRIKRETGRAGVEGHDNYVMTKDIDVEKIREAFLFGRRCCLVRVEDGSCIGRRVQ